LTHNAGFVLWHSRDAPFCHKTNPALCAKVNRALDKSIF